MFLTPLLTWLGLLLKPKFGINPNTPGIMIPTPPPTTTMGPPTTSIFDIFTCSGREIGRYPHRTNCSRYFVCTGMYDLAHFSECSTNLHFSPTALVCTEPRDAGCLADSITPRPPSNVSTTRRPGNPSPWLEQILSLNYFRAVDEPRFVMFYNRDIPNPRSLRWPITFIRDVWESIMFMYGDFGADRRLYVVLHGRPQPQDLDFATYLESSKGHLNAIEVGSANWTQQNANNMDLIVRNLAQIVVRSARGVRYPGPEHGWADIFVHDIYNVTNRAEDQQRWIMQMEEEARNNVAIIPMFTQWYLPIYTRHGGGSVLNRFLLVRSQMFPRMPEDQTFFARSMNRGEFIHFWSFAAGRNLTTLGTMVFGSTQTLIEQYETARANFSLQY